MDHALYVAMTGAIETMRAQTQNNNNLANIGTNGFRAELLGAQAAPVSGDGFTSRVNAQVVDQGWDASEGTVENTGRNLDVAMRPGSWLAVQAQDGKEIYTRAGHLQVDTSGQLRTTTGEAVLGDNGLLAIPPNSSVTIGADGTITTLGPGQAPNAPTVIGRLKVVDATPGQLLRRTDSFMETADGQPLPAAAGNTVTSGALETSNVSMTNVMMNMISLSRAFDMQNKLMRSTEQNDAAASQLVRMSS